MTYENAFDRIETPTVLIADNDDTQRLHIADYFRRRGYGVLEAKTSVEALLLSVDYPRPIGALFTSLSLRKYCNGSELAACFQAIRPGMAVVYLGDMRDAGDEAARDILSGEAILLAGPVREPRLVDAADLIEARWTSTGLKKGFREKLDGAPMLVPTENTSQRAALDRGFAEKRLTPRMVRTFEDNALMKVFS